MFYCARVAPQFVRGERTVRGGVEDVIGAGLPGC
jgi:hypothetical protein